MNLKLISLRFLLCGALCILARNAVGATFTVNVAPGGLLLFDPFTVSIEPGDTVMWVWKANDHSVTSGSPGGATGLFDSGIQNNGFTFSYTFTTPGTFNYFCLPHGTCCNMIGKVIVAGATPTPSPTPSATPAQLLNVSTRMNVKSGDNVLIGGFIVTGTDPKEILLRAIGPSLAGQVSGALADPVLELHAADGSLLMMNDDWQDSQKDEIEATGAAPNDPLESAIVATLDPDSYTAIVRGANDTTGIGLVEAYDLNSTDDSQLANISTRGFVEAGANVMIGGFILGNGSGSTNVLIRALGPSLGTAGVPDALADPILELHDENGTLVTSNDNWKDTQQAEIEATGIPPADDLESAILATLPPTAHTAIVAGSAGGIGVALVEVYRLP